jgi:hypothetical protein
MTDTEMIDWMEANYVTLEATGHKAFLLTYIGNGGQNLKAQGDSLRTCIARAVGS